MTVQESVREAIYREVVDGHVAPTFQDVAAACAIPEPAARDITTVKHYCEF